MKEINKYIYILIDPTDESIKYVGSSKNPTKRLKEHIYDVKREKTKKSNWIKKLLTLNLKPILKIVKKTNNNEYQIWETFYIKKYKNNGEKLLNYDENGIGNLGKKNKITREKLKKYNTISITQFSLDGVIINEYKSLREAERITNINHGNISKCCNGIFKHTGGFIFKKNNDFNNIIPIINPNGSKKKVIEITKTGEYIQEFNSISDTSKKTMITASSISKVCNNLLKKTNNRYFKFKQNE